jgi:hypothetical protein
VEGCSVPIDGHGWELLITRIREDQRTDRRRTVGNYQVYHNGKAVGGLSGACAETRGPGDNSHAGNKRRIKAGRYPLRTHVGPKYITIGYKQSNNAAAIPRPCIEVGKTAARAAILLHPGRGFLSSVGCINPVKALANAQTDINFTDSRMRTIGIIDDLKAFLGGSFPTANGRPIPNASIVVDGEP